MLAGLTAVAVSSWYFATRWRAVAPVVRGADQNVLLITIDTLRADALGCYGGSARTPNLDRLAREGVRFDAAHAQAVVTLVSHSSILTGLYPFQHGVRENSGYRLRPDVRTLAEMLKDHGYATGGFVSAFVLDSRFGVDQGFDLYDDRLRESLATTDLIIPERRGEVTVAAARAWIDALSSAGGSQARARGVQGAPRASSIPASTQWFSWVHVFDPHAPYEPPAPFDAEYAGRPYAGEVAYTDRALGPLLDARRADRTRPTLVIVTSDHGEGLGDHGELTHGLFAYESTLRIPLIMAQLGGSGPGPDASVVSHVPVRHVDIVPTILDVLGIDAPETASGPAQAGHHTLPGRSLVPLLDGRREETERASYFEAMSATLNRGWAPLQGVVAGHEKYIDLPLPELFDLSTDPGEERNLVDRSPERTRALRARLAAFNASTPSGRQAESQEVSERLRALGYVGGNAPRKVRYGEEDDPKRLVGLDRTIQQAMELIERRRFDEAIEAFRRLIADRPDMALGYRHLAFLYWQIGKPSDAMSMLRAALKAGVADQTLDALRSQLAVYLAESGSAREAITLLADVRKATAPDVDALSALGIAYARNGQPDEAIGTFEQVLRLDRANALALQNLGSARLTTRNLPGARDAFERALALDPNLAQAHTGLGVVFMRLGRHDEAFAAWQRAVAADPREYDALYNLAYELLRAGRLEEGRQFAEQFLRTAPPAFYARERDELSRMAAR